MDVRKVGRKGGRLNTRCRHVVEPETFEPLWGTPVLARCYRDGRYSISVNRLSELMAREFTPEAAHIYTPSFARMAAPETTQPANAAAVFQVAVFNFLFKEKDALGISDVWMCRNVRIDGLLELEGGGRVGVEVKYRMNWKKASRAGQQLDWFRNHPEGKARALTAGLVFFEEFNEDWA